MADNYERSHHRRAACTYPTVLIVGLQLLAMLAPLLGAAWGMLIVTRPRDTAGSGAVAMLSVEVIVSICVAIGAAVILLSVAWFIRRRCEAMFAQRRILAALDRIAGAAPSGIVPPAQSPPQAKGGPTAEESQLLANVLAELREANANLLLSPSQRRHKALRLREAMVAELSGQFAAALEAHDFARCEDVLAQLAQYTEDVDHVEQLRRRLERNRASVEAEDVDTRRHRVSDLMAMGAYEEAQAMAKSLLERYPSSPEAAGVLEQSHREATAHRDELRRRLYADVQRNCDSHRWAEALDSANRLLASCGDCVEAESVKAMLPTLEENARIEQVRELRDEFGDMIRRKRYEEAVALARKIIARFPDTKAAIDLERQMSRLEELARGR